MRRVPLFKQPEVKQPEVKLPKANPPTYWRSFEHLADQPQVQEMIAREFADEASTLPTTDRRTFLTLMSASFAAMGLAGCVRRPEEKIIPYQKMPENMIPGIPQFYATAIPYNGEALGLVVECHEGRPTKIEGNEHHPSSLGATMAWHQAMTLELYDPDRIPCPLRVESGDSTVADGLLGPTINPRNLGKELSLPEHIKGIKAIRATWDDALRDLATQLDSLEKRGGAGLRVLMEPTSSPSAARVLKTLATRFPQAKVARFASLGYASATAGAKIAFNNTLQAQVAYDKASVVVAVDSDFLLSEPGSILASKLFSRQRRMNSEKDLPNRLYVAEPAFSVTGMNADHRLQIPASQAEDFLMTIGAELAKKGVSLGALASKLKPSGTIDPKFVAGVVSDLSKRRGSSAIVVGVRQPPAVHALAHAINAALGNLGKTIQLFSQAADTLVDATSELKSLVDEMNKGQIDTLLILGGNPAYAAPGDLKFEEACGKVAHRFYLTSYLDETAQIKGGWALPLAHDLESWGDLLALDGTLSLQQPLIAPIFDGRSPVELLAVAAKNKEVRGHDIVRATFLELGFGVETKPTVDPSTIAPVTAASASAAPAASASAAPAASASAVPAASASAVPAASASAVPAASASAAPAASAVASAVASASGSAPPPEAPAAPAAPAPVLFSEKAWRRALHDGVVRDSKPNPVSATIAFDAVAAVVGKAPAPALSAQSLEVTFSPDAALVDGRFSNNSWLMELPNPITKMVWDNAAWISPKLAGELGIQSGQVLKLTVDGRSIEIPAWIVPGTHAHSVQLHLGWGRKMLGRVASPEVGDSRIRGFNVGTLRSSASMGFLTGAKLEKSGASPNEYPLVVTQEHNMVDDGLSKRPIVQEETLEGYRKDPTFTTKAVHHPPLVALWEEHKYEGYKWGMTIDLNACTGCNACVIACQAENNIPTVGKEQVARQREMHWIRIDRYFSGSPDDPKVINQPMACVHCENAPCENVCPVNATSHSPEGLNEMTYNRCIGTRYCSNNCPYKARRFNFLDYHETVPETIKMLANPNVSVRMRGVMEKCTYCVQRIQATKIKAKREGGRKLHRDEIKVACQQACPADAIVFGDLNDPESAVSKHNAINRKFGVLEELNTKPRTEYLAKIRNPNPELT